ncbi:OPT family oligopeptide transporter [Asticcacaulis taihuensis]|jgi:putative OPT family oligopeptide transporter|uniref:OPT family oligopeptide transporter n=1 Tax=Asticcacaulis taihuensis TaxID=260084 RepID=UPI0026F0E55C|nr:oligopeptide transporter, OPT family [Asticcacaulis taihuensis]
MNTAATSHPKEITLRGILLGVLITLIFTASQVYMGLKVGLTFATSIPAAVISMALLRAFKTSTIQENNIVQTIASSAGTLAAVVFTLPGLLILGWWARLPFVTTFMACAIGGVLGVMYTMPLRRALVTNSDLPYPEGTAAAEVLKVGTSSREGAAEGSAGLWAVILGGVSSAIYAAAAVSTWMAGEISAYFKLSAKGSTVSGMAGSSSLALAGAGHLMGITVGIAMFVGLFIAWGVLMPVLSTIHPHPEQVFADAAARADFIRGGEVRFIGAGVIGVAALWAIGKLIVPVWAGLMSALEAQRKRKSGEADLPRSEHDLPVWIVGLVVILSIIPAAWLLSDFLGRGSAIASIGLPLIVAGVAYIIIAGLLAAAVCGYMAGLIGASNSPVSGVAILAVLGVAVIVGLIGRQLTGDNVQQALVAFCMMVTTVVLAVAVIGNDNLQDLKTGQLVDATPWKQQVALIIGVLAGAAVIPWTLNMLHDVYGFAGEVGHHAIKANAELDAPQAGLISTLAKGAIGGQLPLGFLGIGALIGAGLVAADEVLRGSSKARLALPPLGVGLAIYLPPSVTAPVVVGAIAGWLFEKAIARMKSKEIASRLSILVASGFIVGESLLNVVYASLVSATQNPEIISRYVTPLPVSAGMIVALVAGLAVILALYLWAIAQAKKIDRAT